MSGHNKWSKIKHKKAATDASKSRVFGKFARLIAMESKKSGGNIDSPGLRTVIDRAKAESMPKENIERAVAKGAGTDGTSYEEVLFETYGPGGVAVLITAVTDNINRTAPEIKHLLSRLGYELAAPGSASWAFLKTHEGHEPITTIALNTEDETKLEELLEELDTHDDVQDVYTTAA